MAAWRRASVPGRSRVFSLVAAIAGLGLSCAGVDFGNSETAFSCEENRLCPPGYRCSADVCLREDLPALPDALDRSAEAFTPAVHLDPDRGGSIVCWTRAEERGNPGASVYGAFIGPDGVVHPRVRLATFDARNITFVAGCTPVPGTDGAVVVSVEGRRQARNTLALFAWRPTTPRGFEGPPSGATEPLYAQDNPGASEAELVSLSPQLVGDQMQLIAQLQTSAASSAAKPTQFVRWRMGAAELAARAPLQEPLMPSMFNLEVVALGTAITCDDARNCWASAAGGRFTWFAYMAAANAPGTATPPFAPQPHHGGARAGTFGIPIAAREGELAALWHDPTQDENDRSAYRVAWVRDRAVTVALGPRLPFEQVDTQRPAGFTDGRSLFVLGAAPDGAAGRSRFSLFRLAWGASDAAATWDRVGEIPRDLLGNQPVSSVAARVRPDRSGYDLAWVEGYPPERTGARGVRYVLYAQRKSF